MECAGDKRPDTVRLLKEKRCPLEFRKESQGGYPGEELEGFEEQHTDDCNGGEYGYQTAQEEEPLNDELPNLTDDRPCPLIFHTRYSISMIVKIVLRFFTGSWQLPLFRCLCRHFIRSSHDLRSQEN